MCISIDFNARPSKSALIYQISFPCSDAVNFPLITSFSIHSKPSCKDPVCQTDRDLPYILSWGKTSDEGGSSFHAAGCPLWRKSYIQTDCGGVDVETSFHGWIVNFNTETYEYSYSFNNPSLISKSHRLFYWNNVSGITNENHTGSFFIQQTD